MLQQRSPLVISAGRGSAAAQRPLPATKQNSHEHREQYHRQTDRRSHRDPSGHLQVYGRSLPPAGDLLGGHLHRPARENRFRDLPLRRVFVVERNRAPRNPGTVLPGLRAGGRSGKRFLAPRIARQPYFKQILTSSPSSPQIRSNTSKGTL